jgi:hypothetical protein
MFEPLSERIFDSVPNADALVRSIDPPLNKSMLEDTGYGKYLRFYALLTWFPHYLPPVAEDVRFYNRYYFYRKFSTQYRIFNKEDAGLDQLEGMLLAEGADSDLQVDWELIQKIHDSLEE